MVFSKATVAAGETAVFTVVVKVNAGAPNGATVTNSATAAGSTTDPNAGNNTAIAASMVSTQADLSVTKTDSPDPVVAGSNITYTVSLVNNGPSDGQTVTVTDAVPANTTFVSATATAGVGWTFSSPPVGATGNVVFSKATVAAGETAVFTVVVKVNAGAPNGATVTNSATAAGSTTDPNAGNNTAIAASMVSTQADLSVTKTDSPEPVVAGSNITYTVSLANNGPSDAQGVTVTDAVPANTTFVSATVTTGVGWTFSSPPVGGTGNVVFSKATVAAGETAVFTIVVQVGAAVSNGTIITNTATAASSTTDPVPANNSATATTTVNAQADLAIVKTGPANVTPGGSITYNIAVTNNGPGPAPNVIMTDTLPALLTFISVNQTSGPTFTLSGGGTISGTIATFTAGATAIFQVTANVSTGATVGSVISNTATANSTIADPIGGNNSSSANTTVVCPTITLSPATLPGGTAGTAYNQSVSASPAGTTYTFTVSASSLPPGLTLNPATGAVTGTPTTNGTYNFTITATGWGTCTGSQAYTIDIACPAITLAALANAGTVNTPYSSSAAASPAGTYNYAVTASSLPPGLTLDTSTGAVTGTPTTNGTYNFTITATGWGTCTGSQAYTITIDCPAITLAALANAGTVNTPYSSSAAASPAGTYNYAVTASSLPPGLTLDTSTGAVTGTPTTNGTYNFTITATGWGTCTGSQAYTITIDCPAITLAALANAGAVNTPYNSSAAASPTGTYTYAVTANSLPPGLTLDTSTGAVTGTPTTGGAYDFTVTATGWGSCSGSLPCRIVVCAPINISPANLPNAPAFLSYSQTLTADGGTPPYTFAVTAGSLPSGLTLSPAGLLSGMPSAGGTFNFTVTATDSNGCKGSITYALVACSQITIRPDSFPSDLVAGQFYSIPIWVVPELPTPDLYTVAVTGGSLPPGLALVPATPTTPWRIEGTASRSSAAGTNEFSFTLTASNTTGCSGYTPFTMRVNCPEVRFSPNVLPEGSRGLPYSVQLSALTTPPSSYSFAWSVSPNPPAPGVLLGADGLLSGTPANSGVYSFTVTATDPSSGCSATWSYSLTVNCRGLDITPATLPAGTAGSAYFAALAAGGGTPPYTFAVAGGSLPPGLALNGTTGSITGAPTAGGTFEFTIAATDARGCSGSIQYAVRICNVLTISPAALPSPVLIRSAYPVTSLSASGGQAPYSFAPVAGVLPPGMSLTPEGQLWGTPIVAGVFNFTVSATDAVGCIGSVAYSIDVTCPPVSVAPLSGSTFYASVGAPFSLRVSINGLTAPVSVSLLSGTVPDGFTIADENTLTPSIRGPFIETGLFTFTLRATDAGGCTTDFSYTIAVTCAALTVAPGQLPQAGLGQEYDQTLLPGGSYSDSFTWEVGPTSQLPPGFTLDPGTGRLYCPTAAEPGVYYFQIVVTDGFGCTGSRIYSLEVVGYDLNFVDDWGRSSVCINSSTGAFVYKVLQGTGMGTYYGTCNPTKMGSGLSEIWTFSGLQGDPWLMNIDYKPSVKKAAGSFVFRAERVRSSLYDIDTSDNPQGCF